jgi:hypothetical protein
MYADINTVSKTNECAVPWNKGKLIGQKLPLKLKEIWAIRIRLKVDHRTRELALFNLAIDSKLRGSWATSRPTTTTRCWPTSLCSSRRER